jgi:toxin ParE1/3/4
MTIWSDQAKAQLLQIDEYLSERNPDAADSIANRIYSLIGTLEDFPLVGRSGRVAGTRELMVSATNYIVVYRLVDQAIHILAMMHGAQRWPQRFTK